MISDFKWSPALPLVSLEAVAGAWVLYWSVLLVMRRVMHSRPAVDSAFAKRVYAAHYFVLTVWSLVMWLGLLVAMVELAVADGWQTLFCGSTPAHRSGALHFWLYIYYISKFYELLDTVIILLRKKELIFLHVYHHTIVILMVWFWCHNNMTFGSQGMIANTGVHVAMYYFYFKSVLGQHVWFKKYVTMIQIVQFGISFILSVIYMFVAQVHGDTCNGADSWGFAFTLACNLSFFALFIHFYSKTYQVAPPRPAAQTIGGAKKNK